MIRKLFNLLFRKQEPITEEKAEPRRSTLKKSIQEILGRLPKKAKDPRYEIIKRYNDLTVKIS